MPPYSASFYEQCRDGRCTRSTVVGIVRAGKTFNKQNIQKIPLTIFLTNLNKILKKADENKQKVINHYKKIPTTNNIKSIIDYLLCILVQSLSFSLLLLLLKRKNLHCIVISFSVQFRDTFCAFQRISKRFRKEVLKWKHQRHTLICLDLLLNVEELWDLRGWQLRASPKTS